MLRKIFPRNTGRIKILKRRRRGEGGEEGGREDQVQGPTDEARMPGLLLPNDVTPIISLVYKMSMIKPSGATWKSKGDKM